MDIENCCRICLETKDKYIDLEDIYDKEEQLNYRDILELITNINITREKDTPMNLCRSCGNELQMCYNFQKKVKYANDLLRSLLTNNDENETILSISYVNEDVTDVHYPDSKEFDINMNGYEMEAKPETTYDSEDGEQYIEVHKTSGQQDIADNLEIDENNDILIYNSTTGKQNEDGKSSNEMSNILECKNCNKKFSNKKGLASHLISHKLDRPRYQCSGCTRVYVTKQALETHVLTVHEKKGFKCKFCDKFFAIHKGLVIHMRYHTGDFPYECDQCERKFAQLCHLKTHVNVKHNNARFTCEYANCTKFFTNSASLRNHEFTHSSMPFACEFCEKGYPAKSKYVK